MSALLSATLTSPSAYDKSLTLPMTSPKLLDILFSAVNKIITEFVAQALYNYVLRARGIRDFMNRRASAFVVSRWARVHEIPN